MAASGLSILSIIIGAVFGAFRLPIWLMRKLPEVATAVFLAWLLTQAASSIRFDMVWLAIFLFVAMNTRALASLFRRVAFDFGDAVIFGAPSRRWIDQWFTFGPRADLGDEHAFALHLFSSRPLSTSGATREEGLEAEAFQALAARFQDRPQALSEAIEAFWSAGWRNPTYWRDLNSDVSGS